jgi:Nickel responsive protein SCO4226-like
MPVFLVERNLKGLGLEELAAAQMAAVVAARHVASQGHHVRYLRSTFVPREGVCHCLFEADSMGSVREVNAEAHLPYIRIVEAIDLAPPSRLHV